MLYVPGGSPSLKAPRGYGSKPITYQSYDGNTTVTGTHSPENPATMTPVEPPEVPGTAKQIGPTWSLPNGVKDTYNGETGELVRRVGKLVLNGTESWQTNVGVGVYYLYISTSAKQGQVFCSHFQSPVVSDYNLLITFTSVGITNDIQAFKSWLAAQAAAGTPVTILYELAQPTVEHIIYTCPISTRAADIIAPSWTGKTTVTGEPSPDNPATITGVPFAATATGPDGETHSVDLGFTGYSLPNGTADTFDGVRGDFVQRVGKLVLGNNSINNYSNAGSTETTILFFVKSGATTQETNNRDSLISSHFANKNNYGVATESVYGGNLSAPYSLSFSVFKARLEPYGLIDDTPTTYIPAANAWLAAQAAAGTPVTICYELVEPIANNRKADIHAFEGHTTVTGADTVEVIDGRQKFAEYAYYEIVRVRPNLLDNAYFVNPINQRGATDYSNAGYTIDRWSLAGNGTVAIGSDYLKISATENGVGSTFNQIVDIPFEALAGKTITISALTSDNKLFLAVGTIPTNKPSGNTLMLNYLDANFGRIQFRYNNKYIFVLSELAGKSANFLALKLEEGPTQTLARKVGDQWVLNDPPPDPTLELLKCQRYQLASGPYVKLRASSLNANGILFTLPIPVAMTRIPNLVIPSGSNISIQNELSFSGKVDGFTFSVTNMSNSSLSISASKNGHGLADANILMQNILFNANL